MATGIFKEEINEFFEAETGAYTAFTQEELRKSTYNVKAVIRNMLIEKMGRENIPVVNKSKNQYIEFNTCKRTKAYKEDSVSIQCKFSKQDKDEMTIYFPKSLINDFNVEAGDVWYIYFIKDSKTPYFGIVSQIKWNNLFSYEDIDLVIERDDIENRELKYEIEVDRLKLIKTKPPVQDVVILDNGTSVVKSVSPESAGKREKNRKLKGNMGEKIVIEIEKRRFREMKREDLIPKITHVANKKDGLGYDIISTDVDEYGDEREIYIEVKSTAGDSGMPFYVSSREVKVSEKFGMAYYIYRLYNLQERSTEVNYYTVQGPIADKFELEPTNYKATIKNNREL